MGAFENQIRENETFESLTDLYGRSLETIRSLRTALAEAQREIENLRADRERMNFIEGQGDPTLGWCSRQSTTGRGYRLHQTGSFYGTHATARDALDGAIGEARRTETAYGHPPQGDRTVTDAERLLEMGRRLCEACEVAMALNAANPKRYEYYRAASAFVYEWRERTGAHGREQDVSDELLVEMIHALGCDLLVCEECCILEDRIAEIQRARAAGKKAGVDICATR